MLLPAIRGEHARNFHRRNGFVGIQSHRCIVLIRSTSIYYVATLILAENPNGFGDTGRRAHPLKGCIRGHTGSNDTSVQILLRNSTPLGHSNGGVPFRRIVFSGILIAGVVTFGSRTGFHGKSKFFDISRSKGSAAEGQEHAGMATPVPVANGGTGASSAKAALSNLGIFYAASLPSSGTDGQICLVPV